MKILMMAVLLCSLGFFLGRFSVSPNAGSSLENEARRSEPLERTSTSKGTEFSSESGAYPLFISNDYVQAVELEAWRFLTLTNYEVLDGVSAGFEYSVSFDVALLASSGPDSLVLTGSAPNGDTIIESWRFSPVEGSWYASRQYPNPIPPIGTAITGVPQAVTGVLGAYVPLAQRPRGNPRVARSEVYRGTSMGDIRCMAADPEGRFLLVISNQDVIYQLDLSTLAVSTLYDSQDIAGIGSLDAISRIHRPDIGRIWHLFVDLGSVDDPSVVLFDLDNDGVFDDLLEGTFVSTYSVFGDVPPGTDNFLLSD